MDETNDNDNSQIEDRRREQDPDNIDWGSSIVIALAIGLFGLVIVAAIFGGMNSGLLGTDGPADSDEPESGANTTDQETVNNETADSDDSAENGTEDTQSEASNPGGTDGETPAQTDDESDSSSSADSSDSAVDSDADSDSADTSDDTSDSAASSDSGSDESQEQEQSDDQQDQDQSKDTSDGSGEDDSEDERPVYDLTVHTGNERPVEGADITIERHADGATTTRTTGEDGSVTFPVYPGDYTIRAEDPNGNVEETTVEVTSDTRVEMTSLLNERPETHTLTVTVVDQTGAPIQGAEVGGIGGTLPSGADAEVFGTANSEGKAYLEVYEGHTYLIDVFHPDSEDVITKEIQIEGDESLRFELERSGSGTEMGQQSNETNGATTA